MEIILSMVTNDICVFKSNSQFSGTNILEQWAIFSLIYHSLLEIFFSSAFDIFICMWYWSTATIF